MTKASWTRLRPKRLIAYCNWPAMALHARRTSPINTSSTTAPIVAAMICANTSPLGKKPRREKPRRYKRANDTHYNVTNNAKAVTLYDYPSEVTCYCADDQPDQQCFNCHWVPPFTELETAQQSLVPRSSIDRNLVPPSITPPSGLCGSSGGFVGQPVCSTQRRG